MKEIYISKDNRFENSYSDLFEAKREIENSNEDVTVYIGGGRYFFRESLEFKNINGRKITFTAYNNEKVYFDGGIILDWKQAKPVSDKKIKDRIIDKEAAEKILEIDLSGYDFEYAKYGTRGFRRPYVPSGNELYINTNPYNVAQYPNKGEVLIPIKTVLDSGSAPFKKEFDMRPGTFVYEDDRCDLWKDAKGFYVSGKFHWCYADDTLEVAKIDTENKTITTVLPALAGFVAKDYTSWYAINLLEEIDIPGEYFVDNETEKLYFYPLESIENALIQLSVLETPMIILENVCNMTFKGITFENSRGTGAYIENGDSCIFEDCIFRNLGMVAVQIGKGATPLPDGLTTAHGEYAPGIEHIKSASRIIGSWHEMLYEFAAWNNEGGTNHGIVNCEIYNTGTGGVLLGGGDRKTLAPAGNYVHNCEIYNVNRLDKTYKAGVNISGVGNKVSNCDIYDMPGFAIYLHGNDHIIEYNKIHDVITEVADAGAIYWGRDLSEIGNEIRYNFIYNISGLKTDHASVCAVYLDDYASFNAVYENYFYNIRSSKKDGSFGVIFWNCGGQTSVNNNIFIDCPVPLNTKFNGVRGIHKIFRGQTKDSPIIRERVTVKGEQDFRGVDITSDIWREHYPYLYDLYMGTYHNEIMIWNNPVVNDYYEMFRDAKNLDFTITGDHFKNAAMMFIYDPLMKVDEEVMYFHIVDFDKIGRKEK